jgi:hypothetical protein
VPVSREAAPALHDARPQTAHTEDSDLRDMFGITQGHRGNGVFSHAEEAASAEAASIGQPLSAHLQNRFEQSLKADLSTVRIHTGLSLPRRAMRSAPGLTLAATIFISRGSIQVAAGGVKQIPTCRETLAPVKKCRSNPSDV